MMNEKKKYQNCEVQIFAVKEEDVLTSSGEFAGENDKDNFFTFNISQALEL